MIAFRISPIISLVAVVTLSTATPAHADESTVYEALADVRIGRVFLSPEQRARLDQGLSKPASRAARRGVPATAMPGANGKAAGYIVNGAGKTRVWSNGDFVAAPAAEAVKFPGDVELTRASNSDQGTESLSSDESGGADGSPRNAGAEDDED